MRRWECFCFMKPEHVAVTFCYNTHQANGVNLTTTNITVDFHKLFHFYFLTQCWISCCGHPTQYYIDYISVVDGDKLWFETPPPPILVMHNQNKVLAEHRKQEHKLLSVNSVRNDNTVTQL